MRALVVVRDGALPAGTDDVVAECGGNVVLVGSAVADAVDALNGIALDVILIELGDFRPRAWSATLAAALDHEPHLVLAASPDGRDLAPHLAAALGRPLFAGAMQVSPSRVELVQRGGLELSTVSPGDRFVATLQPGVRGADRDPTAAAPTVTIVEVELDETIVDATLIEVLPPDPSTIDLAEAPRIVGGGAGLDSAERFEQLAQLGVALGASVGATRVITDRSWVGHERQIGTTGVVVDPSLYIAFGISGAVQHTSGLGQPDHIISVNTDPHCPMMQLADLAVVGDANLVLDALLEQLHG